MEYLSIKDVQNEEVKILKLVIDYFEERKINYFIFAGTFLGAVRHKGFIPWDDDIDIALTRDEYEKLIEYLKVDNKLKNNVEIIGYELGISDFPFLKAINKDTNVLEEYEVNKNLWIDIFPLDNAPNNGTSFYKKIKFWKKIHELRRYKYYNLKNNTKGVKGLIKSLAIAVVCLFKMESILNHYLKICKHYNNKETKYVCNNVWGIGEKGKIDIADLKCSYYKFDSLTVKGFENYDKILTNLYGNYMELPPEDKRQTHFLKAWRNKQ